MKGEKETACVIELQYFPCIQYIQQFFRYNTVYLELHEHYQKRSYRNRTYILSAQGPHLLSVPLVKGKHEQQPISEVRISYDTPWYAQHWHAIQTAYGSAPFYPHYQEDIRTFLYRKYETLADFNRDLLVWLLKQVSAPAAARDTTEFIKIYEDGKTDLRGCISPANTFETPAYPQVFYDRLGYVANLSALDLLMHFGPDAFHYLKQVAGN